MSDIVLRIEKLHVGYLVTKGGGTAEFKYAAKTEPQMIDTILEAYGFRIINLEIEPIGRASSSPIFPIIDDDDNGLNAGTACANGACAGD